MNDLPDSEDHYQVLGITPEATQAEIKRAYRDRSSTLHPDGMLGAPESARRKAEQELKRVNRAYQALKDPVSRKRYDRARIARGSGVKAARLQQTPLSLSGSIEKAPLWARLYRGTVGQMTAQPSRRSDKSQPDAAQRTQALVRRVRWIVLAAGALALFSVVSQTMQSPAWADMPDNEKIWSMAIVVVIVLAMFAALYFLLVYIVRRFFSKFFR